MQRMVAALLLTSSEPVAWIGVAESPDGKADVLEFKTPDGVPTKFLLDATSHLPLLMSWVGIAPQLANNRGGGNGNRGNRGGGNANRGGFAGNAGQQANLQMHFSDYKTVSGIKLPHLIQRGPNNETTEELVVKSYKINPSFKANTFTK